MVINRLAHSKAGSWQLPVTSIFFIAAKALSSIVQTQYQYSSNLNYSQSNSAFWLKLICLLFKINNFIINLAYITMKKSNSQKKRSLSNSKNSSNHKNVLKSELLKVYGANNSAKKINNKPKLNKLVLNTSDKSRSKIDKSDYEFPQFSIIFRDGESKRIFQNCRKQKKAKNKGPRTDRSQMQSFNELTFNNKQKTSIIKLNNESKKVQHKNTRQLSPQQQISNLQTNFLYCLKKVFKLLDIFNKGTISEININKWIPEAALYFLGKIFQKIRMERLTLRQDEFVKLCLPLLKQSSLEDIQWFINKTESHSYSKQQINVSQSTHHQLSPIQRRTIQENLLKSCSKQNKFQKNIQLSHVIEKIKLKEAEVTDKLNQAKLQRKSVHFNILSEINPNKPQQNKNINETTNLNFLINSQLIKDKAELPKRIEQKQIHQKFSLNENMQNNIFQDIVIKESQKNFIPNFTFQLPQIQQVISENDSIQNMHSSKIGVFDSTFRIKFQKYQASSQVSQPLSARFISRSIDEVRDERRTQKSRIGSDEDKRLDNLSKKLQSFLRLNAEKIQHNKSFFIDNRQDKKYNYV